MWLAVAGLAPVTVSAGLPSPQLTTNVNPAVWSMLEGSVAVNVALTGVSTRPDAGAVIDRVGAVLVTVSVVAAETSVLPPEVTCTRRLVTEAGPSRPRASSCAHVNVGPTPVASPNVPSPLTSQEYVAAGWAPEPEASRVIEAPSATV